MRRENFQSSARWNWPAVSAPLNQTVAGAKPGKGGVLPGGKVTQEIAQIRGIPAGEDSLSPNRHSDIANIDELLDRIAMIRELTGKPVGVKTAIGGWAFSHSLCEAVLRRGQDYAPDFLVIDGGEGGSGAAPQVLADHMGLTIMEALPRVVDDLIAAGLRQRIKVVASGAGHLARAAGAYRRGFPQYARGFMFARLHPAMRCHKHLPHWHHHQQATAAACGGGEFSAANGDGRTGNR
jgi:hypothetical protein